MIALLIALPVGWLLLGHRVWLDARKASRAAEWARLTAPLPPRREKLSPPVPRRRATRRMVQIAAAHAPVPDGVEGVHIGGRWPQRQSPTDLANAYYQPAHADPAVADTPLSYQGRHYLRDVTGEFRAIIRTSFPDMAVTR